MPSCEEEVNSIARLIDRMIEGKKKMDTAPDLLEALGKLPMNMDILQKTKIGIKVNELRRKSDDPKLCKRAKTLINKWKSLVKQTMPAKEMTNGGGADSPGRAASPGSASSTSDASGEENRRIAHQPRHKPVTHDEIRLKSVELLVKVFHSAELPHGTHDPDGLATRIEEHLYFVHLGTNEKYKQAVRSRIFNLRKNNELRENVLTGVIKPEKFATMTVEEMASEDMKKLRETFHQESIRDHQLTLQEGTPSDMFTCGKCRGKNCTYNQVQEMQTRSADEPMTTFVYCRDCGNRWKFC